ALRLINERRGGPSNLFVLTTKYDETMSLHRSEAGLLKDNLGAAMFDVRVPQQGDIAKAAEWSESPRTFEQKYGMMAPIVKKMGDEFLAKLEMAPAL
ncbi:MAG: ParA family protein, partial [Hyphomonadaceae bacterium]